MWAGTSGAFEPFNGPQGNVGPYPTTGLSGFNAPFVSPNDVTLQNSPFSKNDPWLPAGATETTGNNADAYVDLGSGDGFQAATDFRASVTAPGQFLHTFDPNALPNTTEQRQAAIQQLFYDNNFLHDWYYDSGFDEAAGNAQTDNFGRGGIGGDNIKAEGQDSSGTNNANMSTPSDGGRPRMQMYIFSGPTYNNVLSPAAAAGARAARTWQSGPQSFDYTGDVFIPSDGGAGCTAASYTGGSGKIALVNFEPQSPPGGTNVCSLSTKRNVAIAAGATGFILVYLSTSPNTGVNVTGVVAGITIPLSTMTWNGAAGIFPAGVVINFPAADPLETTTGTLVVEGKGLSGIQSTDYTITFSDAGTANGQVGAAHFYAPLNVDESPASSKNEDFESKNPVWTKGFNASFGNHQPWTLSSNGADHLYHAPDVGGVEDQYLISPPLNVSTGSNFIISFLHRHSFEFDAGGNYDGGRVEITTNGGTTWTPIGTSPTFYNGTLLNNTGNPLQNQAAFVKQNASYPNFDTAAIDLGTTYQGQTVKIRFRAASDTALGAGGWDIASVNFTGIDNTPFTTLIADPGPCAAAVTLTMTPASLPAGTVNNAYSVVLNGAGGTGPYTYDAPTGLPNGLSSAPFGAGLKISGTPTESGSFPVIVNFHDSASNDGSANYTLVVNKGAATIALSNLSQVYDGTPKEATATSTPNGLTGVTITYSQNGNPVASPTNAGSYSVLAHLDNTDYAAPDKTGTLVIAKAPQTIDFAPLANKVFKDPPFTISATATSGLPVTFKVISGPAFLSGAGNTVNLTGAGTVKIRASQMGNANYNAAPAVDRTFKITP